jgi:hypothetical protein
MENMMEIMTQMYKTMKDQQEKNKQNAQDIKEYINTKVTSHGESMNDSNSYNLDKYSS